jgi:CRISPR-associated protein Csb2
MATTIAIQFPLGRYHATPWDRSVNEGTTEWPPSPWRLLRALVATWYTRWPDLPAPTLDALLEALGDPPSYRTPQSRPAHTRHYLPDFENRKGETGGTDLTLDPFLSVSRTEELLVRWEVDLSADQRDVLAKLVELVPYLGRADSLCEARLLDHDREPDGTWYRPGSSATRALRLLGPARPVSRPALEISTVEVRRSRRTQPIGATWVSYTSPEEPEPLRSAKPKAELVGAVRFAVLGKAPVMSTNGVLLADAAHVLAGHKLMRAHVADDRRRAVLGSLGANSDHRHAHWVPIAGERGQVESLVLWVPGGLQPGEVAALATMRQVSGQLSGYDHRGLPPVDLVLQAAGPIAQVAPELSRPAREWRSSTPYLPVRHRKKERLDDYLTADVAAELRYRQLPSASVSRINGADGLPDHWSLDFRRYRAKEHLGQARPGLGLRLEFAEDLRGPLLLGQLSHFGFGIFLPET